MGAGFGITRQAAWVLAKQGNRQRLKGEWVTMLVILVIYFSNFVTGVLTAVSPDTLTSTAYVGVFAAILGITSGTFLGRALRLVTLPDRNPELLAK